MKIDNFSIFDYKGTPTEVEFEEDDNISAIIVLVTTGDERLMIIHDNGDIYYEDSSYCRNRDYDDYTYCIFLNGKPTDLWEPFIKSRKNHDSYWYEKLVYGIED